ncbi:MAG: biotin--[acetyl-CoA-carboxylase] ligase [Verrucomicrobiales bacterium]
MDLPLGHHRIAAALKGQPLGHEVVYFEETASTNDEVHRLAKAGHPEGVVVFADNQTQGRGRRGAEWISRPRKDLLFSVLLRPQAPVEKWTRLAHVAALAVSDAVDGFASVPSRVKWPNDIYARGKKLAGLLIEVRSHDTQPPYAVLGVGLNVNATRRELPAPLESSATSLRIERGGGQLSREGVALTLFASLNRRYPSWDSDFSDTLRELRSRSFLLGKRVRAETGPREWIGTVRDYAEDGSLLIDLDKGGQHNLLAADRIRVT